MESFNLSDVCSKHSTAKRKQPGRFLDRGAHNFVTGLVREKTREGNCWTCCLGMEKEVGDVMVGGHLGHSAHQMVRFCFLVK